MKRALIVGSAPCVWDDLEAAPDWPLIVCNAMGIKILGEIDLWCSIHGGILGDRMKKRDKLGGDPSYKAYGHFNEHIVQWEDNRLTPVHKENEQGIYVGGSSGMFAIQVALYLGYERLILCGVPLEGHWSIQDKKVEHHKGPRGEHGGFGDPYEVHRRHFIEQEDRLIPHVRSMSGWTRLHFGPPDKEWING